MCCTHNLAHVNTIATILTMAKRRPPSIKTRASFRAFHVHAQTLLLSHSLSHTYTHILTHTQCSTHAHAHSVTHTQTNTQTNTHTHTHTHTYCVQPTHQHNRHYSLEIKIPTKKIKYFNSASTHIHTYTHTHIHTYTHTHIHTYTHTFSRGSSRLISRSLSR